MISLPIIVTILAGFFISILLYDMLTELTTSYNPKIKCDLVGTLILAFFITAAWVLYYY